MSCPSSLSITRASSWAGTTTLITPGSMPESWPAPPDIPFRGLAGGKPICPRLSPASALRTSYE